MMENVLEAMSSEKPPAALAMIIGQVGAAYRPLGAMMAIYEDGRHLGHVSSGCIEADIVTRALNTQTIERLTYGRGSPFVDLRLPCGGGMEILILPNPDRDILHQAHQKLQERMEITLTVDPQSGYLSLDGNHAQTGMLNGQFHLSMTPSLKFFVFGNGHEAQSFADLVDGAGYLLELYATNTDTLARSRIASHKRHHLTAPNVPDPGAIDQWSSVTLFFHEHELEEQILVDALRTPAFYIGAQGSLTTHLARLEALRTHGFSQDQLARVHGPIGLIPKVRDPQTLAISVLAEIHKISQKSL